MKNMALAKTDIRALAPVVWFGEPGWDGVAEADMESAVQPVAHSAEFISKGMTVEIVRRGPGELIIRRAKSEHA